MNDDLEKQLNEFYRKLDPPAKRVESQWKPKTRRHAPAARAGSWMWVPLGLAAAAAVLLILWNQSSSEDRTPAPQKGVVKTKEEEKKEERKEEPKKETPKKEAPKTDEDLKIGPPKETPKEEPKKEEPKREEPKRDETRPVEPKKEEPKTERAVATIPETDGTWELAGKKIRGKQKDVKVGAGDRFKAETVTKLVLAKDRFILLNAGSAGEFAPEADRLVIRLEDGELLAELLGPGMNVRVSTRACEIDHVGTIFSVIIQGKKTLVQVEQGRVELRGSADTLTLKAGWQVAVTADSKIPAPSAIDLTAVRWAHAHRAPERVLYVEEFVEAGAWKAKVENGVAQGVPDPGWFAAKIHLDADKPIFEVPVKGRITIVYRADRAAKLGVQLYVKDARQNFIYEAAATKSPKWQTLTIEFDKFYPTEKSKRPGKMPVGAPISEIYLQFGEDGEKITFWVDSITVEEVRP